MVKCLEKLTIADLKLMDGRDVLVLTNINEAYIKTCRSMIQSLKRSHDSEWRTLSSRKKDALLIWLKPTNADTLCPLN